MQSIPREDVPVVIDDNGVEVRLRDKDGLSVGFVPLPAGADLRPATKGLPDDLCRHWPCSWREPGERTHLPGDCFSVETVRHVGTRGTGAIDVVDDRLHGSYLPVRARCLHPGQQQGRRWPSSSSSWVRRMRRSRVVSCLASSTQQMNSLRANGVMSFQASSAVALAISALRRSTGSLCTTPPGTRWPLTGRW